MLRPFVVYFVMKFLHREPVPKTLHFWKFLIFEAKIISIEYRLSLVLCKLSRF